MKHPLLLLGLLAAMAAAPRAGAAVTLTDDGTNWVLENEMLKVSIKKSNGRSLSVIKKTGAGANGNQSGVSESFLTRVNQKAPTWTTITPNVDGDDSDAKRSLLFEGDVTIVAGQTFHFRQVFRLVENSKALELEIAATNNTGADWSPPNPQNGVQSIYYTTVGGSSSLNDEVHVKTATGLDVAPGATTGTTYWWGAAPAGTAPREEVTEGWMAAVDNVNTVINAWTWDHGIQKQFSQDGVTANKVFSTGNRFQLEPLFDFVPAGATLTFKHHLIVDDGITDVSYAAPNSVIAGLAFASIAFPQGATANAAIQINSTKLEAASYDVKNLRLVDADTGAKVADVAAANGIAVAANAHVSLNRQVNLSVPPGNYQLRGELYAAGGAQPITTLISRTIIVSPADVKVTLVQDPQTGNWVLENEVMRIVLTQDGEGQAVDFKYPDGTRSQVNPAWQVFRDYIQPEATGWRFKEYQAQADPFGTDTPTRKTISFANAYNTIADLTKTFTLESMSRSLQMDYRVTNVQFDPVGGQGFYTATALAPGGGGNAADVASARTVDGFMTPHVVSTREWFGGIPPAAPAGSVDAPELVEGWIGVADTAVTDAIAMTWDMDKQKQYRITPEGGGAPVTLNSLFMASSFNRQIVEPHFSGIPGGGTLETTMYAVGDTGYKLVGYAEGKRVMAGIWANQDTASAGGALSVSGAITNIGVTSRTFALKNIRLRSMADGATATFGADQDGIALAPAARSDRDLSGAIPGGVSDGAYAVVADLYEGATKIAAVESQPFTVAPPAALMGDINGDGFVKQDDVILGLRVAGGLAAAGADEAARGDMSGDGAISIEDIVAIARKWQGP